MRCNELRTGTESPHKLSLRRIGIGLTTPAYPRKPDFEDLGVNPFYSFIGLGLGAAHAFPTVVTTPPVIVLRRIITPTARTS